MIERNYAKDIEGLFTLFLYWQLV